MNTATTNDQRATTFSAEVTDTFAGEANYAWVRRATFTAPDTITDRALVRMAKKALGLTGMRCRVTNYGDHIQLDVVGACVRAFILPND